MIDINKCPICEGDEFKDAVIAKDYTVSNHTFNIKQCKTCELLITSPRPDDKDLPKYYESKNYISHADNPKTAIDWIYLRARNFTLSWKARLIEKYASEKSLLDYGCGTGEFIKYCQSIGWNSAGIEPATDARNLASKKTGKSVYQHLDEVSRKYEIITLWHVLEHISDLNLVIVKIKNLLNDNGTLFIAVPNHNSWDANFYKQYWAGYDTPRHLWHFSQENVKALFNKHQLSVRKIIPMKLDAFYISLISEQYKTGKPASILTMLKAFWLGLKSNHKAKSNHQYSSLIYIIKHEA